ncbi:hypothetical protein [Spiroplasma endosymbiont of Eupeodes luniger]|uniref:hypothetical protein n=1 Tax=Spiroplasma endosymbiont of Eupeodes luniger TaxID=3066300 RepID=UPI0030D06F6A
MVSYLLSISYDGSKYWGWPRQNNKITVEGSLMAVITSAFNCEFKIQVENRTDKKVHSYDQKVKLSFNIVLEPKQLQWILNNKLPNDIYITNCCIVANDFHVRKKCVLKTYH